jgi:hypothetical protein
MEAQVEFDVDPAIDLRYRHAELVGAPAVCKWRLEMVDESTTTILAPESWVKFQKKMKSVRSIQGDQEMNPMALSIIHPEVGIKPIPKGFGVFTRG